MRDPLPHFYAVIMAAGRGTRMQSARRKVLHEVAGLPMLRRVADACFAAGADRAAVVVPPAPDDVGFDKALAGLDAVPAVQAVARGTGDAAHIGFVALGEPEQPILVLAGDVPALRPETLGALVEHHLAEGAAVTVATMIVDDPAKYGRMLRAPDGSLAGIVEWKEASDAERAICEVNTGLLVLDGEFLKGSAGFAGLRPAAASGELYLTDLVAAALADGRPAAAFVVADPSECTGVNDRAQLARVQSILRTRAVQAATAAGVSFEQPDNVVIDPEVSFGRDCVVEAGVRITGRSEIASDCTLHSGAVLHNVRLGEGAQVGPYAVLEDVVVRSGASVGPHAHLVMTQVGQGARVLAGTVANGHDPKAADPSQGRVLIGDNAAVGPMAHLRPHADLGAESKVGNFVEIKNVRLGRAAKAGHLAYLGDGEIGEEANIGAGVIFCNYDGVKKNRTVVGARAFVGSDSQLVAPVTIGEGAYVGSGSTITRDVPPNDLAVSRGRQKNLPGYAERLRRQSQKGE